ncbi:MAG: hypothetical protein ACLSXO_09505 [Coprococcus sp.]
MTSGIWFIWMVEGYHFNFHICNPDRLRLVFIAVVKVSFQKYFWDFEWFCNLYDGDSRNTGYGTAFDYVQYGVYARDTNEIFVEQSALVSTPARMWLRLSELELNPLTEDRWRQVVRLDSTTSDDALYHCPTGSEKYSTGAWK